MRRNFVERKNGDKIYLRFTMIFCRRLKKTKRAFLSNFKSVAVYFMRAPNIYFSHLPLKAPFFPTSHPFTLMLL